MNDKTTDELIEMIIKKVGIKLPTYDYEYKKYVTTYPDNISIGGKATGIEKADMHDTFREGCLAILKWNKNIKL